MWKKYILNSCVFSASHKQKDSPLYQGYLSKWRENGTHFWGDSWCGFTPLKDKFSELFDIIVVDAAVINWKFTFRRRLSTNLQIHMDDLHMIMCSINLNPTSQSCVEMD
jgi:hypothetical protein